MSMSNQSPESLFSRPKIEENEQKILRKKVARVIPFGYKQSEKEDYIDSLNLILAEQGNFGDKKLNEDEEWRLIKQLERCDYIYKGYRFC